MPRPQKKRFVCRLPQTEKFFPSKITNTDYVKMTVDEYEAIRLIDLQNCTQEECSSQMHVSRTTVQSIYNEARRKIADTIVNSKILLISGGDYITCSRYNKPVSYTHLDVYKRQALKIFQRRLQLNI